MQNDFQKLAELAKQVTTSISPTDAYSLLRESTSAILIETRDPHNVPDEDIVDGSIVISMDKLVDASENLIDLADLDPRLADKAALIITT